MNSPKIRALRQEAQLIRNIDHPNIVKYIDFFEDGQYLFLKMELIRRGTLKDLIETRK